MEGSTSKETHFQYARENQPNIRELTNTKYHDNIRILRVENAARAAPDGLRFVERGARERGRDPRFAAEDEDAGGRAARERAGSAEIGIGTV